VIVDIEQLRKKVDVIAAEVHNAWWREKEKQGFHPPIKCPHGPHGKIPIIGEQEARDAAFSKHCDKCHTDMYPYNELPDNIREYDRVTVRAVLNAIEKLQGREGDCE
jgi:hypothetical protein